MRLVLVSLDLFFLVRQVGFVKVLLGQSWSELVRFGWAGLVSRELVSHGTVGLVLFWFGR